MKPLLLQSYCQATCGIFLQQLIPTKLPMKVPFKVRNVTLVTIAGGGIHRTMAECVFYLGETTPEKAKCVFDQVPRGSRAMPPTHYWRKAWHSKFYKILPKATRVQTKRASKTQIRNKWTKDVQKCAKSHPKSANRCQKLAV